MKSTQDRDATSIAYTIRESSLCESSTDRCWESIYLQRRGTVTRRGSLCSDTPVVLEPLHLEPHLFPDHVCDDCYRWSFAFWISRDDLRTSISRKFDSCVIRKKFFFFYSIKRTRVVDRSIFLVNGQQRNFAILRFVLFFIFLAHSTIAKFLAGRLKGKRSLTDRRTQFRSPLEWEIGKQSWQTNFSCGNDAVKQRTTSFCYGRIHIHIIFLEKSQHPWEMLV